MSFYNNTTGKFKTENIAQGVDLPIFHSLTKAESSTTRIEFDSGQTIAVSRRSLVRASGL
jgi:hypothetical protein